MAEWGELEQSPRARRSSDEPLRPPTGGAATLPARARASVLEESARAARGGLPQPALTVGTPSAGRPRASLSDAAFGERSTPGGDRPAVRDGAAAEKGRGSPAHRANGAGAARAHAPVAVDAAKGAAKQVTEAAGPTNAAPSGAAKGPAATEKGSPPRAATGSKGGAPKGGAPGGGSQAAPRGVGVGAPGGASGVPDELVDHYMETHWEQDAYRKAIARVGRSPLGDDGKPLLPAPEPSAGVESGIVIGGKIVSGLIDQVAWGVLTTLPGVGLVPIVLDWVSSSWTAIHDYGDMHDGMADVLFLVTEVRDTVDLGGSIAINLSDTCALISDAIHAGVLGSGGIAVPLEAINGALIPIHELIRVISVGFDSVKAGLDQILVLGDLALAERLEAQGLAGAAAKAKELASGNAYTYVGDLLAVLAGGLEILTFGVTAGGEDVAKTGVKVEKTLEEFLAEQTKDMVKEGGLGGVGLSWTTQLDSGEALGDLLPEDLKALLEVVHLSDESQDQLPFADSMNDATYIRPPGPLAGGGEAAALLNPARAATGAEIGAAQKGLGGAQPEWYQELIDDFLSPAFSYNKVVDGLIHGNPGEVARFFDASVTHALEFATSPVAWVEATLHGMLQIDELATAGDQSRSAIGALLGRVADMAPQAQVVVDGVNRWMAQNKPKLDQTLEQMAKRLQEQKISFAAVDGGLATATALLDQVVALGSARGQIATSIDALIEQASRLKLDPAQLQVGEITADLIQQLASSVPGLGGLIGGAVKLLDGALPEPLKQAAAAQIQAAVAQAAAAYNAQVDPLVAQARQIQVVALAKLDGFIVSATAGAKAQIASFQKLVADGGPAQATLQAAYDRLAALVKLAVDAFAKWSGQIRPDFGAAAAWLRGVAATLYRQTETGRKNAWTELLQKEAQPYVSGWKGQHGPQVEEAYFPPASPLELGVLHAAAAAVRLRIDAWRPHSNPLGDGSELQRKASMRLAVQAIERGASALAGRRGRRAMQAMWALEGALASVDRAVPGGSRGGGGAGHP